MAERKEIYGWYPTTAVKPTVREVSYFDGGSVVTSPVDTTEVFKVRVRFSKQMDSDVEPTVWLDASSGTDPTVSAGGSWSNVIASGDSYTTPNIILAPEHIGVITVGVSGGQAEDGNVMNANNAADIFTLRSGAPTQRGLVINEGTEYINRPNVVLKWSAADAAEIYISGDVQAADNTHQWIPTNASGDGSALGSGDVILVSGDDGIKTVYAKFKNTSGDESPFVSDYILLDRSGDAIGDVACAKGSGGAAIGNASWTTHDKPYFSWSAPISEAPIKGYAYVLTSGDGTDAELPAIVNLYSGDIHVDFDGDPQRPGKHKFFVKAQDEAGNWGSGDQFDYWLASGDQFHIAGRLRLWTSGDKATEITDGEATASGDGMPYMEWNDPQSPGDDTFYINTSGDDANEKNFEFSTTDPDYTFGSTLGVGLHRILLRPITGLGISGDLHEFTFIWASGSLS